MACANCEMLERQLAIAKKELAFRGLDMRLAAIIVRLGVTDGQAKILLRLYAAGGRWLRTIDVADALRADVGVGAVRVQVQKIREMLGGDWILTAPTPGDGYSLSPRALSQIMAALEPLDLQDARP